MQFHYEMKRTFVCAHSTNSSKLIRLHRIASKLCALAIYRAATSAWTRRILDYFEVHPGASARRKVLGIFILTLTTRSMMGLTEYAMHALLWAQHLGHTCRRLTHPSPFLSSSFTASFTSRFSKLKPSCDLHITGIWVNIKSVCQTHEDLSM